MQNPELHGEPNELEETSSTPDAGLYVLRLFVTGTTPQSKKAITNISKLCEEYLDGRYELEIIDIYQQPEMAQKEQIIAAPTLIKHLPPPLRKLIGNLSDQEHVLAGLNLKPRGSEL